MSGGRRAAGWFPGDSPDLRKYQGHPEASRRELFRKDRRIRELGARVFGAESLLEFISAVAHGKVGGNDLPWIVETIKDAVDRYDVSPQRRHDDTSGLCVVRSTDYQAGRVQGAEGPDYVIADIDGIPNDGGGW